MPDRRQPEAQSQIWTKQTAADDPVDIASVIIDATLPPAQRMQSFLTQIKDPYRFLCGKTPVRVSFRPDGKDLGDLLRRYFISLKRG